MEPTTIENKPKTYTRPILLTKNNRPYIPKKEYVEEEPVVFVPIDIQYLFDNNLNSSPSGYDLTSNGSITYETTPKSVHLDGSSYLSGDISIDVKALGLWFKINTPTIDNYLISTTNDVFNVAIYNNNTELNITINNKDQQTISYNFLSNKWYHLLLNYSNEKYEIYINSNLVQETVDYTALNNNTLYLGKSLYDYTPNFNGNIADLRLYNYSVTDISTIYDEFFDNLPSTDFTTITFDNKTIGSTDMLSSVPNGTTELNIVNNSILYNSVYEQGSGLYIDFTKTNLQNVIKVTITNEGTIYGRGGIGQTSIDDNRREGKYAIKVLNNDDNINREIKIINNGYIYGGGDGGDFRQVYWYGYEYLYFENYVLVSHSSKYIDIPINTQGGNAQYYNGTSVISATTSSYILSGDIILAYRPSNPLSSSATGTFEYRFHSYPDLTIYNYDNYAGQPFNTNKIIDLPLNGLVTLT